MQFNERPLVVTGLEALNAMRLGVNYYHTIKCRHFQVRVRPLSVSEIVQLNAEVQAKVLSMPKNMQTEMTLQTEVAKAYLMRASSSDIDKIDYQMTERMLDHVTPGELSHLFKEYNSFVESVDPSMSKSPDEEIEKLALEVKKSPELLTDLSRSQLLEVVQYLLTKED